MEDISSMTSPVPDPSGRRVIIIGAGPAGLTAAYDLIKRQYYPIVIEKLDKVGGISRTENYKGYSFDMGGHRFFTKSVEVNQFWNEILGDEFLLRPRLSRIYYKRKFFLYPLKPMNALTGLGFWESTRVAFSYLRWQLFPYKEEKTFEQWVTNRFGYRLFSIFFKSYTEKVWGVSTSELNAEWAAQRIKDLDLKAAIISMFIKPNNTIKTLIEEFHYPAYGPGMLWNKVKERIEDDGGKVLLSSTVCAINRSGNRIESVIVASNGEQFEMSGSDFISSMPLTEFVFKLNPPPPVEIIEAARKLTYRDYLTVCLIVNQDHLFDDNWIYVHDPNVTVGRVQNYKNWSPFMVPDPTTSSLGLEYFANEGDELWGKPDDELIELGKLEIDQMGLAKSEDVIDGIVFRVEKAYPVYDSNYRQYLDAIRKYVDGLENFQTVGRNGLHRYNNQDHAMLTGMLAVRNIFDGEQNDLWNVNAEQEYQEEIREEKKVDLDRIADVVLSNAFMKIDPISFALALGIMSGLGLFFITIFFAINAQLKLSDYVWLLVQYLPNYKVSIANSWIGFGYGFLIGFIFGWLGATLRNSIVKANLMIIRKRAEMKWLSTEGYFLDTQPKSSMDDQDR